ncbi:cytochrome P450 [Vibrio mediterranei]|uniref:cytochrome P450 n=1 Tax=Vibrio mediterranei TaxID=689 RepID=UPI00148DE318|nr:cytochrome P450 [Vibrio mediterranei]NOH31503.1 cytochrome P450 [Vibrio mediterranei]
MNLPKLSNTFFNTYKPKDLQKLHQQNRVFQDENGNPIFIKYDDICHILKSKSVGKDFRRWKNYEQDSPFGPGSLLETYAEEWMKSRLPYRHKDWRKLLHRNLFRDTNFIVETHTEMVCDEVLQSILQQQSFDFMDDIAYKVPVRVMAHFLGLPFEHQNPIDMWARSLSSVLEPSSKDEDRDLGDFYLEKLADFILQEITVKQEHPKDDFLSKIIHDDLSTSWHSLDELVATVLLLFISGSETTASLMGLSLLSLARNPQQLKLLLNQPSLVSSTIEEVIRYDGPAAFVSRVVYEDIKVSGLCIPKGEMVQLALNVANHDPEKFSEPSHFLITRTKNEHLGFGLGNHSCLGAVFARIETKVIITKMLAILPKLQVHVEDIIWNDTIYLKSIKHLPCTRY